MRTGSTHLVLGGCGFIGRHIALALAQQGETVVIGDRVPITVSYPKELRKNISWKYVDLQTADWSTLICGFETIHHYAWPSIPESAEADPAADLAAGALTIVQLLEAMRRRGKSSPRLVFASSGGTVYGKLQRVPVREDHPLAPITAYGAGKVAAELYLELYRSAYGLDCRIARISNPFGAGQSLAKGQGAATVFLHRALTGQPIQIWGNGEIVRDYIHIADLVEGLVALARMPAVDAVGPLNIASGQGTSLNGIVLEIEKCLDRKLDVHWGPGRVFDVPVSILDIEAARSVLAWSPRLSFADGMSRTLSDFERGIPFSTLN